MTISFPRDLPEPHHFRAFSFDIQAAQARSTSRGGVVQVVNLGVDLWSMRYETPPLREPDVQIWQAWLHSLRGGARLFRAWHPARRYAQGYASGYGGLTRALGGSFDGTANLFAIGTARDTVTINTLPPSFALTAGDMLSFPFLSSHVTLHRIVEGGSASGGGALTVAVEPTVPLAAVTGVTVAVEKPHCLAVVDAKSIRSTWQIGRRAVISFDALQAL